MHVRHTPEKVMRNACHIVIGPSVDFVRLYSAVNSFQNSGPTQNAEIIALRRVDGVYR